MNAELAGGVRNTPPPEQLDMFKEAGVQVETKNGKPEQLNMFKEAGVQVERKNFNERVADKAKALEQANLAFKNGDTSSYSPEEIENLKNKMPGFIRLISGRIENIKNETNESNKAENDIKIKELERLLRACQENQTYFESNNKENLNSETSPKKPEAIESIKPEPENEQYQQLDMFKEAGVEGTVASEREEDAEGTKEDAEGTKEDAEGTKEDAERTKEDTETDTETDAERTKGSAQRERPVTDRGPSQKDAREIAEEASLERERYKNLDEITKKLIESNDKLRGLLARIQNENLKEEDIPELERQIEETVKEIENLMKQLNEREDDLSPEDTEESERLMTEMQKLKNEIKADPISLKSQNSLKILEQLSEDYQKIQDKISQEFNERNRAISLSFESILGKPIKLKNENLANRVEEVLKKSQEDYREKFSNIEKKINSGSVK